jgi:hypothetical protein
VNIYYVNHYMMYYNGTKGGQILYALDQQTAMPFLNHAAARAVAERMGAEAVVETKKAVRS